MGVEADDVGYGRGGRRRTKTRPTTSQRGAWMHICYDDLKTWWDACEIASLVLPSSGTAERVFSLTKMLFSDRQDSLLFDALKVSLFTAYNRR